MKWVRTCEGVLVNLNSVDLITTRSITSNRIEVVAILEDGDYYKICGFDNEREARELINRIALKLDCLDFRE